LLLDQVGGVHLERPGEFADRAPLCLYRERGNDISHVRGSVWAVPSCTELRDNPGQSITVAAEWIAGEVISFHRLPTPLVWIEQRARSALGTPEDPYTFDLVTFASYEVEDLGEEGKLIGEPVWKPLDRATVEALIGQPIDQ
jgi:hypothetical protein